MVSGQFVIPNSAFLCTGHWPLTTFIIATK
jgi:hypothetical protein